MDRRRFLKTAGGAALTTVAPQSSRAQSAAPKTVVYKVAQGCEIKADVYRTGDGTRRPALLWIHGGALIMGSRKSSGGPFQSKLLDLGYVVVSVDYRLAPETKLPGIIEDLRDAYRWMRTDGGKRFGIDPDRIAAGGGSAGGYLTLMTGFASSRVRVRWYPTTVTETSMARGMPSPMIFTASSRWFPRRRRGLQLERPLSPSLRSTTPASDSTCIPDSRESGLTKWRATIRTKSESGSTPIAPSAT
jgi:acetyl esterase/lipase